VSFTFFNGYVQNLSFLHWRLVQNILFWFFLKNIRFLTANVCLLIIRFVTDYALNAEQV